MNIEVLSEHTCFGGKIGFYRHQSYETKCSMRFSLFVPSKASSENLPILTYLSGLTCTEETFMIKSGGLRVASELGLIILVPDTSPRGENIPTDPDNHWDFGLGAGFYLDATQMPYSINYRMYSYVVNELPELISKNFPADINKHGIFGHSMGGHGALTIGIRNNQKYKSISAFAPICAPTLCPWGTKAFTLYLGNENALWENYDSCLLIEKLSSSEAKMRLPILIDQGLDDQFLESQLNPHLLEIAAGKNGFPIQIRRHRNYDHSYFMISTFIEDHLHHHASLLTLD